MPVLIQQIPLALVITAGLCAWLWSISFIIYFVKHPKEPIPTKSAVCIIFLVSLGILTPVTLGLLDMGISPVFIFALLPSWILISLSIVLIQFRMIVRAFLFFKYCVPSAFKSVFGAFIYRGKPTLHSDTSPYSPEHPDKPFPPRSSLN
jgi:hypothetical protein